MTWLDDLADKAVNGELPAREEALAVLASGDDELLDVVAAAFRVRRRFFGRRVKLNYLVNIKSGLCPEDCFYCSQRVGSAAEVLKYTWLKTDEIVRNAEAGVAGGARRVCLVASGRGPTDRDVDRVCESIEAFKSRHPDVEVCACLGLLSDGQADRLAAAGTTAYNHNLNTSGGHYADICSTHEYADRVSTVTAAKEAGLSPCSGLIAGMGETDEDLVDVAFALRALSPDSVPVNFLIPFEGTPAGGQVGAHPAALPAHPGDGPLREPRRGSPPGRRPRDPPAHPAAPRPARRELDLPRRLPDQRRPARRRRPSHDRRRGLRSSRRNPGPNRAAPET